MKKKDNAVLVVANKQNKVARKLQRVRIEYIIYFIYGFEYVSVGAFINCKS